MWGWIERLRQFVNTVVDRLLGREAVVSVSQTNLAVFEREVAYATQRLLDDASTVAQWQREMRDILRRAHIEQYLLGIGGAPQLTRADYGSIGGMLADQYRWLDRFAQQLADGSLSPGQIANRALMYAQASGEAFQRAYARAWDIPFAKLPAYPRDGSTKCLCITTPESRVLTARGWIPLLDVRVGDRVWTHRGRWRPVTALIVKPSLPSHSGAVIRGEMGSVGCTTDHLWWTPSGWHDSIDIDNLILPCYHYTGGAQEHGSQDLRYVRYAAGQPQQRHPVSIMSPGLSLREAQRLSGDTVPIVRVAREGDRAVAESGVKEAHLRRDHLGSEGQTVLVRGPRNSQMAGQVGWAALQLVLAGRSGREGNHLSIPVGVDYGERPHPGGLRHSPHRRRSDERRPGQPRIDAEERACASTRQNTEVQSAVVDMSMVRPEVPEAETFRSRRPEILFTGLLPPGTAVFDLSVEEDHSFVIEGLVAHNSRCGCNWLIEPIYEDDVLLGWECTWVLNPELENCEDCLRRASEWAPLTIMLA